MPQEYNTTFVNDTIKQAEQKATEAYNQGMLQYYNEKLALEKAQQAWKEVVDKAGLTGMYEGQLTMPTQQWMASTFGSWGAPSAGQGTLAQQQQYWSQAYQQANAQAAATGYYQGPQGTGNMPMDAFNAKADRATQETYLNATGGNRALAAERYFNDVTGAVRNRVEEVGGTFTPDSMRQWTYSSGGTGGPAGEGGLWGGQGTRTLAGQEQDYTQWLRAAQEARANQALQQQTANQYLTMLAGLRGPADWAKYQQVLGATPGGMSDLVSAAMGQYIPGGGATTGYQPQAANLQTLQADVQGWGQQGYGQPQGYQWPQQQQPQQGGLQAGQFTYNPQQMQAANQQQIQQPAGQLPPAAGGGTNMMGAQQPQQNRLNLPAPNQIAPQSWNNLAPSQRELILGEYESQGWHKPDVEALMNQGLPKYAANAPGAGTWRLR